MMQTTVCLCIPCTPQSVTATCAVPYGMQAQAVDFQQQKMRPHWHADTSLPEPIHSGDRHCTMSSTLPCRYHAQCVPPYMYSPSGTPSFFLYSTFSLALRKSACVTRMRRSRSASRPASVHTALMSAPLSSSLAITNSSRFTSSLSVMRPVWMEKMRRLVLASGSGNSILRSMRPGRMSAGSSDSMRLVAMMTLTSPMESKPSSWLSSSSMVRCTSLSPPPPELSVRADPMESTSSMKMMEGACSRAMTNSSRTMRDPSPMYFCTSSLPMTRMKHASVRLATARASSVLPVPGGPYMSTPFGGSMPSCTNFSG
mmetsp:Transcript_18453/g.46689  ORF Transcript_18453/g.46689 Transcript_18453/m.46689 type:complete len:313 (-) Transcript_18453:677-1615(-)